MATPKKGYWIDGVRVPGTTTILSRFKDAGGLIHWAWQMGVDGKDYREERDTAASVGSCAHDMVEARIRQVSFDCEDWPTEILAKAKVSFGAFEQWANDSQLVSAETEVQLISKKYRYGGTPDVFFVRGKRSLGDWKTSNAVYPEYLCQLAAYKNLWEENYPDQPIEGGAHLIRFDKTHGDFHHHYYTDLDDAWEAFKHMRALYDLDKILKKESVMTNKTLIRNLKRLEKVMVWMLDLPVEHDSRKAVERAYNGETVVCFNNYMYKSWLYSPWRKGRGLSGCVAGFYDKKTGRSAHDDFDYTLCRAVRIFALYQGKGDTVRSRLAIVRRLIKKMEREDDK